MGQILWRAQVLGSRHEVEHLRVSDCPSWEWRDIGHLVASDGCRNRERVHKSLPTQPATTMSIRREQGIDLHRSEERAETEVDANE